MITPEQIRGARAMLKLKQADLAKAANLSTAALASVNLLRGTRRGICCGDAARNCRNPKIWA
jgi:hypothetical protein